jgi:hypothetical protein
VDVLNQPPSKPYKSFAVLEYEPSSTSGSEALMEGLKKKARELGADAIIICQPGGPSGFPDWCPQQKCKPWPLSIS